MRARYTVLVEPTTTGFSAYVPDLPGCVATGETPAAVASAMASAIGLHLEGLLLDGAQVPLPERYAITVEIPVPPAVPGVDIRREAARIVETLDEDGTWDEFMEAIMLRAAERRADPDGALERMAEQSGATHRWRVAPKPAELTLTALYRAVPEGVVGVVAELPGANAQGAALTEARARLWEATLAVLEENRRLTLEGWPAGPVLRERQPFEGWWPAPVPDRASPESLSAHFVSGTTFRHQLPPAAALIAMLGERPSWDELGISPWPGEWPRAWLSHHPGAGFVVQVWDDASSWSEFVATAATFAGATVAMDLGGLVEAWPAELFVPEAVAVAVLEHFLAEGRRHPGYVWVRIDAFPRAAPADSDDTLGRELEAGLDPLLGRGGFEDPFAEQAGDEAEPPA